MNSDRYEERQATPADVEALETAVSAGYFAVPRQCSLIDIAEIEEIDSREASERIRRALDAAGRELFGQQAADRSVFDASLEGDPGLVERLATETADRGDAPPEGDPAGGPDPTSVYRALAAPERRQVLFYLRETSRATVQELVDVVSGYYAAETGPVGPDERATIETAMHGHHLPVLEATTLVERDDETVSLGSPSRELEALLDAAWDYDLAAGRERVPAKELAGETDENGSPPET